MRGSTYRYNGVHVYGASLGQGVSFGGCPQLRSCGPVVKVVSKKWGLPFPPFPSPFPPLLFPPLAILLPALKLPQRGLGRRPSRNWIWCILALKFDIWWQQIWWFSWEQNDQISCIISTFYAEMQAELSRGGAKNWGGANNWSGGAQPPASPSL